MIPKIIHQIAPKNKSRWHPIWKECHPTWAEQFPDFEHKLWNDEEDIDNLVKDYYPQYWDMYSSFSLHIQRIDFARLCILHKYGGIYADMDVFCYKNFYSQLTNDIGFIGAIFDANDKFVQENIRSSQHLYEHNTRDFFISNCLVYSTPNHKIIDGFYGEIQKRYEEKIKYIHITDFQSKQFAVVKLCVDALNHVLSQYEKKEYQILNYKQYEPQIPLTKEIDVNLNIYTGHFQTACW